MLPGRTDLLLKNFVEDTGADVKGGVQANEVIVRDTTEVKFGKHLTNVTQVGLLEIDRAFFVLGAPSSFGQDAEDGDIGNNPLDSVGHGMWHQIIMMNGASDVDNDIFQHNRDFLGCTAERRSVQGGVEIEDRVTSEADQPPVKLARARDALPAKTRARCKPFAEVGQGERNDLGVG